LYTKRDDISAFAFGGNKVRQLEFYLGEAVAQKADTVLVTGAVQSNFVRLCAAAALGAEIHYLDEGEDEAAADAKLDRIAQNLREEGSHPYVIHLGVDSTPIGGLGYTMGAAECFIQLKNQRQHIDHVVLGSGSGLTHSGFLCGARAIGWDVPVHGICVRRDAVQQHARITRRADEVMALLGNPVTLAENDVQVYDEMLTPGYGIMNDGVVEAIKKCARLEALMVDSVYTGRVMAGLIALVRNETIKQGESVLFIHTGGLAGLFAYQNDLLSAMADA